MFLRQGKSRSDSLTPGRMTELPRLCNRILVAAEPCCKTGCAARKILSPRPRHNMASVWLCSWPDSPSKPMCEHTNSS